MNGFSFNGHHSSEFGLYLKSIDRTTLPELRKRKLTIPGKHGSYDFGNNTYDDRTIDVECFFKNESMQELRQQIRIIASWLKDKGKLLFDDEPDKYYVGRFYNQIPLDEKVTNGLIPLSFECEPFAYSEINTTEVTRTNNDSFFVFNNGTVDTPAEYTITNTGTNTITNVTIKIIKKI